MLFKNRNENVLIYNGRSPLQQRCNIIETIAHCPVLFYRYAQSVNNNTSHGRCLQYSVVSSAAALHYLLLSTTMHTEAAIVVMSMRPPPLPRAPRVCVRQPAAGLQCPDCRCECARARLMAIESPCCLPALSRRARRTAVGMERYGGVGVR